MIVTLDSFCMCSWWWKYFHADGSHKFPDSRCHLVDWTPRRWRYCDSIPKSSLHDGGVISQVFDECVRPIYSVAQEKSYIWWWAGCFADGFRGAKTKSSFLFSQCISLISFRLLILSLLMLWKITRILLWINQRLHQYTDTFGNPLGVGANCNVVHDPRPFKLGFNGEALRQNDGFK
jgi:hypothetical protein